MTQRLILAALLLCVTVFAGGCFTRTVYVPAGTPVRLRETIKNVKVWVPDENDRYTTPGKVDLSEGGYYVPDWEGSHE